MLEINIEKLALATEQLETIAHSELLSAYMHASLLGHSSFPDQLVDGKSHSFLQAIYYAYSDHRPFTLTPESIWLLINKYIHY